MFIESWFHTPIWCDYLDFDFDKLKDFCLEEQTKNDGRRYSNDGGWQSFDYDMKKNKILSPLYKNINNKLKEIQKQFNTDNNIEITNAWININKKGNKNHAHIHPKSLLSGVVYISSNDYSGNLVFSRNDGYKHYLSAEETNLKMFIQTAVSYKPEVGKIIIFPSWIEHYVEENLSDEVRISLSFNTKLSTPF